MCIWVTLLMDIVCFGRCTKFPETPNESCAFNQVEQ